MGQRRLGKIEQREDIRSKSRHELAFFDVEEGLLRMLLGRVVHEDVELAVALYRCGDGLAAGGFVTDVGAMDISQRRPSSFTLAAVARASLSSSR